MSILKQLVIVPRLLDVFFPCLCAGCGTPVEASRLFCAECEADLAMVTAPFCQICGCPFTSPQGDEHICGECLQQPPFFKAARSVFIYKEPIKRAIIQFKFLGCTALAELFAKVIITNLDGFIKQIAPDIVIPVPLHLSRLRERGYNQCLLLAKRIARILGIPCKKRTLQKVKPTMSQVGLSLSQRRFNVKGSFTVVDPDAVQGRRILLIDDVFTTGSTVNECAKVLVKAGADGVWVITLARTNNVI
ncbi:MAG: ComF family protein [Candidatus Desulfofervidaceae bacterium]|nr:ComF family protein [Candidatus Desulfofervidaceae bacterium]